MNLLNLFLMAQPAAGSAQGSASPYSSLIMIVVLMVIFWLFFIRPQSKKANEQKKFQDEIKRGDRIVTIGGIHGKIAEVSDNSSTVVIESEGTRIKIEKAAINAEASAQLNK